MSPIPPVRAPHFVWDQDGAATLASAQALLALLCSFVRLGPLWRDRSGGEIAVRLVRETEDEALIELDGALRGRIELSIDPSLWVRADVLLGDSWFGRGWVERGYEECEIWPDAADGVIGDRVEDDPPGRISKRGTWIQFDAAQWPEHAAMGIIGFEVVEP